MSEDQLKTTYGVQARCKGKSDPIWRDIIEPEGTLQNARDIRKDREAVHKHYYEYRIVKITREVVE